MRNDLIVPILYRSVVVVVLLVYGPWQLCKEVGKAFHRWRLWAKVEWASCEQAIQDRKDPQ